MQVRELMSSNVISVAPEESAALAARLISRYDIGALPVCSADGRLRGMLTDRDIVLRCVAVEEDPGAVTVRDIMTRNAVSVAPEDDVREAARIMAMRQVRRLPVVENGKVVGVFSLADMARRQGTDVEAAMALSEISMNIRKKP